MKPFNQAWTLLKRQTTLGEHKGFEDASFSPYGPITHYHGTTGSKADSINSQGLITARPGMADVKSNYGTGVYASKNRPYAEKFATRRGYERAGPRVIRDYPVVYGIRGTGLETRMNTENLRPLKEGETEEDYPVYFPEDVSRERLIEMGIESQ